SRSFCRRCPTMRRSTRVPAASERTLEMLHPRRAVRGPVDRDHIESQRTPTEPLLSPPAQRQTADACGLSPRNGGCGRTVTTSGTSLDLDHDQEFGASYHQVEFAVATMPVTSKNLVAAGTQMVGRELLTGPPQLPAVA